MGVSSGGDGSIVVGSPLSSRGASSGLWAVGVPGGSVTVLGAVACAEAPINRRLLARRRSFDVFRLMEPAVVRPLNCGVPLAARAKFTGDFVFSFPTSIMKVLVVVPSLIPTRTELWG